MANEELIESLMTKIETMRTAYNNNEFKRHTYFNKRLELFKEYIAYEEEWLIVFERTYQQRRCYISSCNTIPCPDGKCSTCVKESMYDLLVSNVNHTIER